MIQMGPLTMIITISSVKQERMIKMNHWTQKFHTETMRVIPCEKGREKPKPKPKPRTLPFPLAFHFGAWRAGSVPLVKTPSSSSHPVIPVQWFKDKDCYLLKRKKGIFHTMHLIHFGTANVPEFLFCYYFLYLFSKKFPFSWPPP